MAKTKVLLLFQHIYGYKNCSDLFSFTIEIPGPSRKTPVNKHGSNADADTNDILKQKQLRVTYQPDDEDLYGSAEDFDDNDSLLPPLTPNVYYTTNGGGGGGGAEGNGGGGNGNSATGHLASASNSHHHKHGNHKTHGLDAVNGGRHHYNTMGNSFEFGANAGAGGGGGIGINGLPGVIGNSNVVTRKPTYYSKTEVRSGAMDNNDISSSSSSPSSSASGRLLYQQPVVQRLSIALANWPLWCCHCCCLSYWPFQRHWPYLIVLLSLLYSLITTFCWNLL